MPPEAATNFRVGLYARVSTEEQREGQTIDSQVEELKRFAQEQGWEITGVYKDEGWSGSILARPELDRLRDDASKGSLNAALINDVDRLARDVTHLGVIKRDLERYGVQVIFRKLPSEKSPTHNLMVNILGSFAEFEREMIADRTRRGKRHKVEVRQQYLGSIASYGFRYIRRDRANGKEGMLQVDPEEAAVVRQMYCWVDQEGLSARKVLSRLNDGKVSPRKGKATWAKSSVLRILRNEIYSGVWHYFKFQACVPINQNKVLKYRKSSKSSRRVRPRDEWVPVVLPEDLRIVPRDRWLRVQQQLDRNKAFSPRNEKHIYLLKGLLRCGGCGHRYIGQPSHGKFYYRCIARCRRIPTMQEGRLNESVWAAVEEAVLNPDLVVKQVAKLTENRNNDIAKAGSELAEAGQGVLQIEKEEARLVEAYRLGILSPAQLGQELEKTHLRKASLDKRKTDLSQRLQKIPAIKESIMEYCRMASRRVRSFGPEERQRFLRYLVRDIVFDGTTIRIRAAIPVSGDCAATHSRPDKLESPDAFVGDIATTKIGYYGRNAASDFQGVMPGSRASEGRSYFAFELEASIAKATRNPSSLPTESTLGSNLAA
jgi:site-specific DNA recombinase